MLRILVFGVMGLLLAGLGTVAYIGLQPPSEQSAVVAHKQVAIVVANGALRAGSLLQPADFGAHEVDEAALPQGARHDGPEERRTLTGAMLRRSLSAGEAILGDDVLRPGDRGFLAAVLAPGTRAVSVAVDAVSGAAGLIWPGDRVDVILTQTLDVPDQRVGHRVAGETVLADARVIAVDQQLVQGGQASGLLDQHGAPSSRTITLEVDPRDAARIAVATRLGKLQVVLRAAQAAAAPGGPVVVHATETTSPPRSAAGRTAQSPAVTAPGFVADADGAPAPAGAPAPIWGGDVSQALGDGGGPQRNVELRLFQGTRKVETYRF